MSGTVTSAYERSMVQLSACQSARNRSDRRRPSHQRALPIGSGVAFAAHRYTHTPRRQPETSANQLLRCGDVTTCRQTAAAASMGR